VDGNVVIVNPGVFDGAVVLGTFVAGWAAEVGVVCWTGINSPVHAANKMLMAKIKNIADIFLTAISFPFPKYRRNTYAGKFPKTFLQPECFKNGKGRLEFRQRFSYGPRIIP
jgi:hypothetical protein